jgi:hypothetical protein
VRQAAAAAVMLAMAFVCVTSIAGAADKQQASASIRSLTVSGTPAKPIFIIRGTHLTVPARNPSRSPSDQPLCPLKVTGHVGFDYGNTFYLIGWDGQPTGHNNELYSAGRYRPSLNELDCIGLIVRSHSPAKIAFTFGHAYAQFPSQYRELENGDVIEVVLNGAPFATVVHFHHHTS